MPPEITEPAGSPLREISGQFADILVVTELRGAYPNVPIAADVDYAALVAGDPDPSFITIPIGKANVTSGNGRFYDDAWLQELERQTLETRPIGLMGHLSEKQRATEFPPEAVHWVGVLREQDSGVLWGKAYIVPGEARDRIRRYKAQGKSIATSIDAHADGYWDESLQAYRMDAKTLKLGQIDIAPADRAGIGALARVPVLTKEMSAGNSSPTSPGIVGDATSENDPPATAENEEEITLMDKIEAIREMTVEDADLLPKAVKAAILSEAEPAPEVAQMAGIRELLGLDDKADVGVAIRELSEAKAEAAKKAVTDRITELLTHEESGIKQEKVRPVVRELVEARKPQTPADAETAYKAVLEMASVKELLQAKLVETMGPPQRTPVAGKQGKARYFEIPKGE